MSLNVVVTGVSGFVGRHVVAHLRTLPNVEAIPVSRMAMPGVVAVNSYFDTPGGDVLIHLAEESDRLRANLLGSAYEYQSKKTIDMLLKKGFQRILYASSAMLYSDDSNECRRVSDPVCQHKDTYLNIKRSSEEAVLESGGVVARLTNLYGSGMSESNVFSAILRQVPGNDPLIVTDSNPVRDFLWIDDAAAGLVQLATCSETNRLAGRLYNLGTGTGISIGELAHRVLVLAGQGSREVRSMSSAGRISARILDCSEMAQDYGWRAETSLDAGIGRLLAMKVSGR